MVRGDQLGEGVDGRVEPKESLQHASEQVDTGADVLLLVELDGDLGAATEAAVVGVGGLAITLRLVTDVIPSIRCWVTRRGTLVQLRIGEVVEPEDLLQRLASLDPCDSERWLRQRWETSLQ